MKTKIGTPLGLVLRSYRVLVRGIKRLDHVQCCNREWVFESGRARVFWSLSWSRSRTGCRCWGTGQSSRFSLTADRAPPGACRAVPHDAPQGRAARFRAAHPSCGWSRKEGEAMGSDISVLSYKNKFKVIKN